MSPQTVAVSESGNPLIGGSASVSLTDANSDLTTTPATTPTSNGVATFSSLIFTGPTTSDTLTATLALDPSHPTLILTSAPSSAFNIGAITPAVTFTGAPASASYNSTFTVASTTNSRATVSITSSGACSNLGTLIKMTSGTGTCNLTATWLANGNYNGASLTQSTLAAKIAPAATFTGAPASAAYNSTFMAAATTNASTAASIGASGACSNTGASVKMTSGTGTCNLTATWAADSNYNGTSLTQSTSATAAGQIITPASVPTVTTYGTGPYTLNAAASSGLPVSYSVSGPATLVGTNLTITGAGSVIIAENQTGNGNYLKAPTVTQTISVSAVPLASISPGSISFGTLYLGAIVTKTVTITNVGDAAMTIKDPLIAIVQGGNSNEFITVNLCPASLAAGKSCTMTVTFVGGPFYTPQTATLTINDNVAGSPQAVILSATVIDPVPAFSATSLSFGTVKTATPSAAKSITVTNVGGTALTVSKIAFAGADPADFSQTNSCSTSLAPKGACTVSITFKPGAKGSGTATLVVTDNAVNSSQSIPLSGTGN